MSLEWVPRLRDIRLTSFCAVLLPDDLMTWHKSGGPSSRNVAEISVSFYWQTRMTRRTECLCPSRYRFADVGLSVRTRLDLDAGLRQVVNAHLDKLRDVLEQLRHGRQPRRASRNRDGGSYAEAK